MKNPVFADKFWNFSLIAELSRLEAITAKGNRITIDVQSVIFLKIFLEFSTFQIALKEYSINEKIFMIAQINETKATIVTTPSLVLLITTSVNERIYLYTSGFIGRRLKRELTIN